LLFRIGGVGDNRGELSLALGLTPAANPYAIVRGGSFLREDEEMEER